jgi:hypothetical protein
LIWHTAGLLKKQRAELLLEGLPCQLQQQAAPLQDDASLLVHGKGLAVEAISSSQPCGLPCFVATGQLGTSSKYICSGIHHKDKVADFAGLICI